MAGETDSVTLHRETMMANTSENNVVVVIDYMLHVVNGKKSTSIVSFSSANPDSETHNRPSSLNPER